MGTTLTILTRLAAIQRTFTMTSLAAASSVNLLRRVAFLGGTPLGNSVGSIPSVLALTNSVIRREYHEKVIDHYENPRNVGKLDAKKRNVGTGLVGAPACGDVMKLQIEVDDDGQIIDAKFKTFGCGSAIASSSLATEWIKGKSIDQAAIIKNSDIANELNLPPVKLHCSMLAEDAIRAALKDYKTKRDKEAVEN